MTFNFFVRSAKPNQPATIRARVRSVKSNAYATTPFSVRPDEWNDKKGRAKIGKNIDDEHRSELTDLNTKLQALESSLTAYATMCEDSGIAVTSEGLNKQIENTLNVSQDSKRIPKDILGYWDWLIERMKDGSFLKPGSDTYDRDTIKVWVVTRNVFKNFKEQYEPVSGRVLVWDNLDKAVMDAFIGYMENYGYLKKSINKYIITFKALIKYASKYHNLHENLKCLGHISKRAEVAGCATTKTYMTDDELQALYDMTLEPGSLKDKVRDLFLVGCYTCQRVSDFAHFKPSNFSTTAKGTKVIRLVQEKTNNVCVIPVLNDNLNRILDKYGYQLPDLGPNADVLINRYLKNILKELSESVPSLKEPVKTILTLREKNMENREDEKERVMFERDNEGNVIKPKYDTISCHSARRSGITNLYKSHLFTNAQLMSISGHTTEKIFLHYISQSADELADEIARIMKKAEEEKSKKSNEGLF